ncbi:hypothetical protein Vretimale_16774 [Volvox reticuliferus]|uniref:Uncharacterized protein n=1 Tax=Volvox reticuliferus TaxID=1737510 RepID=A0A8J4LWI1_9CHLO|nr:hypothetical protein Vretimale_16774 [Volvox reticuliferus]
MRCRSHVVLTPSEADIKSLVRDTLLGCAAERHPELISLVDTRVTSVRLSRAESTWRLYDPIIRKWAEFCNRSGSNPLGGDPLLLQLSLRREVARRILIPTQRSTDVVAPDEVSKLVEHHIREEVDLLTRMVVTSAVLAFCGLLRFDDLQHILVHTDVLRIYADQVAIFLFKSKTDQHCKGAFITIGRISGPCCPVHLLEQLLMAG